MNPIPEMRTICLSFHVVHFLSLNKHGLSIVLVWPHIGSTWHSLPSSIVYEYMFITFFFIFHNLHEKIIISVCDGAIESLFLYYHCYWSLQTELSPTDLIVLIFSSSNKKNTCIIINIIISKNLVDLVDWENFIINHLFLFRD